VRRRRRRLERISTSRTSGATRSTWPTGTARTVDRTEAAHLGVDSWSTGASFFDFDKDGDLDLSVANYVAFDEAKMRAEHPTTNYQGVEVMKGPQGLPSAPDCFFVNEGGLVFREASAELGMSDTAFGFQSLAFDFDLDGWLDLFVGNDSVGNNLWHNLAGKRFEDVALRQGLAFSLSGRPQACMGATLGDYNGDGRPDLYVTKLRRRLLHAVPRRGARLLPGRDAVAGARRADDGQARLGHGLSSTSISTATSSSTP